MALIPQQFEQANKCLHGTGDIKPLYIYTDGQQCMSCWKLSLMDRLKALFFGKVWLCVLGGKTQPPVWIDVNKNVFDTESGGDQ